MNQKVIVMIIGSIVLVAYGVWSIYQNRKFGDTLIKMAEESEKKAYNDEDLEIDIEWMAGYGIDREESKKFIVSLLEQHSRIKND